MKATETKSTHSQQHTVADQSSADQERGQAFFSESSEQTPFFHPTVAPSLQTKPIHSGGVFFQPAAVPKIQAKSTEDLLQREEAPPEQLMVQRIPAFESSAEPPPEEPGREVPMVQRMPAFSSVGNAGDGDDGNTEPPPVQFSLKVGQPGDAYEREADAMADRIVSMPRPIASDVALQKPGQAEPQPVSRTPTIRKLAQMQQGQGSQSTAPKHLESRLQQAKGDGDPLDANTRSEMEGAFNADFSKVQVHSGQEAATLNQSLGARAFTQGNDIFFNTGEYQPQSHQGKHLLAHELTHTIQQGQAVQRSVDTPPAIQPKQTTPMLQKVPAAAVNQPILSSEVVDVSTSPFNPSEKLKAEIEAQGNKGLDVRVIIRGVTSEGRVRIRLDSRKNFESIGKGYLPLLNPWAQQLGGMYINFTVKNNEITGGYASLTQGGGNTNDWLQALQKNPTLLGGLGLKVERLPKPVNKLENGKLTLGVDNLNVEIGGYVNAQFNLFLENASKPKIDATANINVKGIAQGVLKLDNTKEKLTGEVTLTINVKAFNGEAKVQYNPDGTVDIGGKAAYNANKLSGEIQFVATDLETANRFGKDAIAAAGGKENVQNAPRPAPVPKAKSGKKERALAATGQLAFNLTTWFAGTVNVVVDGKGDVTVIGKIAPPAEIELFKQRDWDKELIKFEAKAYYGIPVVGNLNLFANISLHALAKLGPAKIYNIEILGTYSTDPEIQKNIQISGSINISAYAGLRLRAEGGAGVEILDHDLKFGVGLNADVGVKAYADARPTIGYRDPGVFYISGTLEMVAQPMLGLGGDFFIELETPWWSPLSDKKWIWPLFSKEWPLTDPIGISATVRDYELGSGQVPEVELRKPEFDPSKFMTSMVDNKLPDKSGGEAGGQGTFKEDGSVPKPTVPPKKPEPKKANVKPVKKGTLPQGGKSAAPDPKAAADQNNTKTLRDAAKLLTPIKAKAPLTHADLNKELAKVKGQVSGVDFAVQPKGEMWVITPKAGGKTGKPLELNAKDVKGFGKKDKTGKYDGEIGKVVTWTSDETHSMRIVLKGRDPVVVMASEKENPILSTFTFYESKAQELAQDNKTKVISLVNEARGLVTTAIPKAKQLAEKVSNAESLDEAKAKELDDKIEELENQLGEVVKQIQLKLRLKQELSETSSEDLTKAKRNYKNGLFSTSSLAEFLKIDVSNARRRVAKWISIGLLFKSASAEQDPGGFNTFDPAKAGIRETSPNNRAKYGYVNPKKDSMQGMEILSKGFHKDIPAAQRTANRFNAKFHQDDAFYYDTHPDHSSDARGKKFQYPAAVLGHKKELGASEHWNLLGYKQSRDKNMAWNKDPNNYHGPEYYLLSRESGGSSERYKLPRADDPETHSDWLN
jgi:hypothetical protein